VAACSPCNLAKGITCHATPICGRVRCPTRRACTTFIATAVCSRRTSSTKAGWTTCTGTPNSSLTGGPGTRDRSDRGEPERHERVPARERQAEKAPGRFSATHYPDRLERAQEVADIGARRRTAAAIRRSLPDSPLHTRVKGAEPALTRNTMARSARPARQPRGRHRGRRESRRERNPDVIGDALVEAELARHEPEHVLRRERARDGCSANETDQPCSETRTERLEEPSHRDQ
jgi:hypothetical protein